MMRVAGRDSQGSAKAFKTNSEGELVFSEKNSASSHLLGNFIEPYEAGYVGNVMVSGLAVYGNMDLDSDVIDVKTGKDDIYVADNIKTVKKFGGSLESDVPIWTYTNFMNEYTNTKITRIMVDKNDDVILIGTNGAGHRMMEKISGKTGVRVWLNNYNNANYIESTDSFVDKNGDVYTLGAGGGTNATSLLRKHAGTDGVLLWELKHVNPTATSAWHMTVDTNGYIYLSSFHGVVKFDQSLANTTTSPTIMWTYTKRYPDASGEFHYINIANDGSIYRIERTYYAGVRAYRLVKLDQSSATTTIEPLEVWHVEYATNISIGRVFIDSEDNIYTMNGKTDPKKTDIWGGVTPFVITDIRDDFLYGFKSIKGYHNENTYRVLKTGIDLKPKTVLGVK